MPMSSSSPTNGRSCPSAKWARSCRSPSPISTRGKRSAFGRRTGNGFSRSLSPPSGHTGHSIGPCGASSHSSCGGRGARLRTTPERAVEVEPAPMSPTAPTTRTARTRSARRTALGLCYQPRRSKGGTCATSPRAHRQSAHQRPRQQLPKFDTREKAKKGHCGRESRMHPPMLSVLVLVTVR